MSKNIVASLVGLLIIFLAFYIIASINDEKGDSVKEIGEEDTDERSEKKAMDDFVQCLKEEGVVIYGSTTCPACSRLEEEYGGYEIIKPLYLDCSRRGTEEELAQCREEMKTEFVPEIQIKGDLFDEWGSPEALAKETGCEL